MADLQLPPDFEQMGRQITAGAASSGFYTGLAKSIANGMVDATTTIVGTLLNLITQVAVYLVGLILGTLRETDPAMVDLARLAVADLLGTDFPPIDFRVAQSSIEGRRAENQDLGRGILRALFGTFNLQAGQLAPGSGAAEGYLGVVTSLGIKGWFEGIIGEIESLGFIRDLGELKNVLASSLGLGRMSRAVMRPIVRTLLVTPFEWQLEDRYRPKLHGEAHAIALFTSGVWDFARLDQELGRQGWSHDRILQLVTLTGKHWGESELQTLLEMGLLTFDQAVDELKRAGDDERHATYRLFVASRRSLDSHASSLITDATDRYIGRRITRGQLDQVLQPIVRSPEILTTILNYADIRRSFPRALLTMGDAKEAVKRGIWDLNHFQENVRQHGFSDDDVTTQELLLLAEIRGATQAEEAKHAAAEQKVRDQAAAHAAAVAKRAADQAAADAKRLADRLAADARVKAAIAAAEARREFAVAAADERRRLAEANQLAGVITVQQAENERAAADVDAARAKAAEANAIEDLKVSYADQIADLRRADKLAGYQLAFDAIDVDEADGTLTAAGAAKKRAAVELARSQFELTVDQDVAAVARGAREAADIATKNAQSVAVVVARQRQIAARGASTSANLRAAQRATDALNASLEARRRELEAQLARR